MRHDSAQWCGGHVTRTCSCRLGNGRKGVAAHQYQPVSLAETLNGNALDARVEGLFMVQAMDVHVSNITTMQQLVKSFVWGGVMVKMLLIRGSLVSVIIGVGHHLAKLQRAQSCLAKATALTTETDLCSQKLACARAAEAHVILGGPYSGRHPVKTVLGCSGLNLRDQSLVQAFDMN